MRAWRLHLFDRMSCGSEYGGSAHAESPEWMPASSMCSITPPTTTAPVLIGNDVDVELDRLGEKFIDQAAGSRPLALSSFAESALPGEPPRAAIRNRPKYSSSPRASYTRSIARPPST